MKRSGALGFLCLVQQPSRRLMTIIQARRLGREVSHRSSPRRGGSRLPFLQGDPKTVHSPMVGRVTGMFQSGGYLCWNDSPRCSPSLPRFFFVLAGRFLSIPLRPLPMAFPTRRW
ncbi:hypothetical protein K458DRAFT_124607 [Lentithecium fluviatile CBS 122367]|uniref:Uncharacterized protein n=1 Tax=Lentithecium fluviatile CBS 122367 TaxID=1168545 RepID=A0A6G1JF36_9PLEO|nr:hypothetical protein K458DRAFT_124607 [Lentithecium fluviatile CBS 122367]